MDKGCEAASRRLSRHADGELPDGELGLLRAHLDVCEDCRRAAAFETRLRAALGTWKAPAPPEGYGARLREEVHARLLSEGARGASPAFRWTAAAAVVLLSAAVMLLAWRLSEQRAQVMELAARSASEAVPAIALPGIRPVHSGGPGGPADQLQAFVAARDFFGGRMRWMASDGDQVEFGVSGGAAAANGGPGELVLLQFRYVETGKDLPARVLSGPEFVLASQEEASVRLKGRGAEEYFRYRVKATPAAEGQIRALVNFAREGGSPAPDVEPAISAHVTLTSGKPVLLTASGDATRRQELYLWGTTRPASAREGAGKGPL